MSFVKCNPSTLWRTSEMFVVETGSAIDPGISPEYVEIQIPRVARTRSLSEDVVREPPRALRSRWQERTRGSIIAQLLRRLPEIDIHVIAERRDPVR